MDTGEIIKLTKRERDIETILKFFYTNCAQEMLDVHSLTPTTTEYFKHIIIAMYHHLRKSSEGWTYNIHDISRTYPKDEILVQFFQTALHFKTDQLYRQFLKENNLQHFLLLIWNN